MNDELISKKRMYNKKIIIAVALVLSTLAICFFVFLNSVYNSAGSQRIDNYRIKGIGNDSFYVEIYKVNFLKPSYSYVVFDNNKKRILGDEIDYAIKIIVDFLHEDESVRVYELSTNAIIFFDKEQGVFRSILLNQFPNAEVQRYRALRNFALKKVGEGQWKWVKTFSEYLIKADDKSIVTLLKRYANGEFSNEEMQNNKNCEYSIEYMKNFSNELISKYNLR